MAISPALSSPSPSFRHLRLSLLMLALLLLSACEQKGLNTHPEAIRHEGVLRVLTLADTGGETYDHPVLLERELAEDFASFLGVEVEFIEFATVDEVVSALVDGQGHMAAAGFTRTTRWEGEFDIGPSFYQVSHQVVCRRGGVRPGSFEDLLDASLLLNSEYSLQVLLQDIYPARESLPQWRAEPGIPAEATLKRVWEQEADCTVAPSHLVSLNRRFFPELTVEFTLPGARDRVWLLPQGSEGLAHSQQQWFDQLKESSHLNSLLTRYYSHVEDFDYVDTRRFLYRIEHLLPQFRQLFEEAGERYDIDWRLLAAQAYQESHWNPAARSPTGVRGIMMLTLRTAGDLGISSRLNAAQSIDGGARYLASLHGRLPESVTEPDRTWQALAAYNVGMGHLYDARGLARELGYNPDLWSDMQEVLPLLAQPEFYRDLRFGRARGQEPVEYVTRIRNYYAVLLRVLEAEEASAVDVIFDE
ncbi:membrane-bound lytic murein transglycosylase MltF [Desulfurispira natronophila]|uniref:Membrane-bound lytic murein transglycosylase F n=1 Tax=Desulfurispira natronophila TaxID=682562 RepID=A0A7W7Y4I3_9BACT|nr:membrane-bound lytic murein transglycosylase MltF [Desulfurispira natronophila]MBB5021935.1 membrane-bound lytic murein transglycosylase F [Desulfurispira natronophila]